MGGSFPEFRWQLSERTSGRFRENTQPIAYIDKIRGEDRWTTSVFVAPQMVTDSLIILSGPKPAYISIHEIKENRKRRVNSLTVQCTNPEDE
jgi:hypothetical protein